MKRRKMDFHDYDEPAREADHLLLAGYRQLGNWNLSRTCEHLAVVMEGSLDGFAFPPSSWFWRRVLGPVLIRLSIWTRWIKQGLECPDRSFCPVGNATPEEAVERFKQALRRVRDPGAEFHAHPVLGKVTAEQWREVHLIHAAHHFSFLLPNEIEAGAEAQVSNSAAVP